MEEKDSCCILDRYKAVSRSVDLVTHYDSMHKDIFDTMTRGGVQNEIVQLLYISDQDLVVKDSMIYL